MDMNLSKLWEIVEGRGAWYAAVHGVRKRWSRLSDWTTTKFLCTYSAVFIIWSFNWVYIFTCQWPNTCILGGSSACLNKKERISESLYLFHGYIALDRHQKVLTNIIRFPNVIDEQLFYNEKYWNYPELEDRVNGVETMFKGTLDPLFAVTLRNRAFSLCLCFPIAKLPAFENAFIWLSLHIKDHSPYETSIINSSSHPTKYECEVNSLRSLTMFQ